MTDLLNQAQADIALILQAHPELAEGLPTVPKGTAFRGDVLLVFTLGIRALLIERSPKPKVSPPKVSILDAIGVETKAAKAAKPEPKGKTKTAKTAKAAKAAKAAKTAWTPSSAWINLDTLDRAKLRPSTYQDDSTGKVYLTVVGHMPNQKRYQRMILRKAERRGDAVMLHVQEIPFSWYQGKTMLSKVESADEAVNTLVDMAA